jgi:hypothetical protein
MRLLPDRPLSKTTNKSIDFAYDDLAKNMVELIDASPRPFTIGLFGKWGTGKSTIIESLKQSLNKNQYVFVKFDVWKYESDALRRSFLIDLAQQLKGRRPFAKVNDKYIEHLRKRLYTTTQKSEEQFKLSWRSLIIPVFILGVIAIVYWLSSRPIAAAISGALGFMAIDTLKNYFLDKSHFTQQIFVGKDRINSPEEFYGEFKEMISQSKKTFVIVIDNLDRTQKEKTIELLSTVKTFLNADDSNDNVVFVIASDDKAIKEHITAVYSNNGSSRFDANEFLKKFFNVVIEIPVFIDSEINSYTKKLLNQTEVPEFNNNTDLQQIINYAYNENPREIKQYINNLAAFHLLLTKGVPRNGLTDEFVTKNLNFICKLLIVRDRFSNVFEHIKKLSIENALTWSEIESRLKKEHANEPTEEEDEYEAFTGITSWSLPSDESIAWFFRLRRSSEDLKLPGWDLFINAVLQQDYENAQKLFQDFEDTPALSNQLSSFINSIKNDPARITPFFGIYTRLLLELDDTKLQALKDTIDLTFLHSPASGDLPKIIGQIDLNGIIQRLGVYPRQTSLQKFTKAVQLFLKRVKQNEFVIAESDLIGVIDAVEANPPTLDLLKSNIREEIANHHPTQAILSALSGKEESLKRELVTDTALQNYLASVNANEPSAVGYFESLGPFDVSNILTLYFDRLYATIRAVNGRGDPSEKARIIEIAYVTLNKRSDTLQVLSDDALANVIAICETFSGWYTELPTDNDRLTNVLILALLAKVPGNTANNFALSQYLAFVRSAGIGMLTSLLDNQGTADLLVEAQQMLSERMVSHPEDIEQLMSYLEVTRIPFVVSHLSQVAVNTPDQNVYQNNLLLIHKLYLRATDVEKTTASESIFGALLSGINRFPDIVKAFYPKRFISAEQRQRLKDGIAEYEASLVDNSEDQ